MNRATARKVPSRTRQFRWLRCGARPLRVAGAPRHDTSASRPSLALTRAWGCRRREKESSSPRVHAADARSHLGMATELGKRFDKHVERRSSRRALVQRMQDERKCIARKGMALGAGSSLQQSRRASQLRYRQQQKPSGYYR